MISIWHNTLLELTNVLIPYFSGFAIRLFPMWKTRDVKSQAVFIAYCCNISFVCAGFFILKQFWDVDYQVLQFYKACMALPSFLLPFWVFRKRIWQNIFTLSITLLYGIISIGSGMYIARNWFQAAAYPFLAVNLASLAVIALTLPPLLFMLRRLCENPHVKHSVVWRLIWLLPASYVVMFLVAGFAFESDRYQGHSFFRFQIMIFGVLLFTCYLLEAVMRHVSENAALREQDRMAKAALYYQREQYARLAENEELAKRTRHDIRQHLALIMGYNTSGDREKLVAYVEKLAGTVLVSREKTYCENFAVIAVAAHYITEAERREIKTDIRLDIPAKAGRVDDMDLCVVMGNLLENAVEACRRVEGHNEKLNDKFIRARAVVKGNYLTIMVENSFDGICREREEGGAYISRKETHGTRGVGVGLSSVRAVCEKYGGLMKVDIIANRWKTSALVDMRHNS
jgi:signal transduction histidine kinase